MKKIIGSLILLLCFFLTLLLCYANYRLYDRPNSTMGLGGEAIATLRALKKPMHDGAPQQMQTMYPEGFVFMHALYALSWCDVLQLPNLDDSVRMEASKEVRFALSELESNTALQIFNANLPLAYGAYYRGWSTYVQGRYIESITPDDTVINAAFKRNCSAIAAAISHHDTPWLDSYDGMAWPGDNIICLAALSLHDRLFKPTFTFEREVWLQRIKKATDPETGLIPHYTDAANGTIRAGARGSSQVLMLAFLPYIDPDFSKQQYQRFRTHFLTWRMGLPGFREYPLGFSGNGDIDSGPVIAGIGGVATIVGQRASLMHGDCRVAIPIWATLEGLLYSKSTQNKKTYLFGALPIIDVFMAWCQSTPSQQVCQDEPIGPWRLIFQVISLLMLLTMAWLSNRVWKWFAI